MSAPREYDHVIVGAGMVADAAARGIREIDPNATIAILGEEPDGPFPRPALSKDLWTGDADLAGTAYDTAAATGAHLHLGDAVTALDTDARTVTTSSGAVYRYGRLLLATGGRPRTLPGLEGERVVAFRTVTDYTRLRALVEEKPEVLVVGAGFIGTEIACALAQQDVPVTLVHPGTLLADHFLVPTLAHRLETLFLDHGIRLRGGAQVTGGTSDDAGVHLELDDGSTLDGSVVVIGLGVEPATELAVAAGLTTSDDGGVVVDSRLATSAEGVYAAGDIAQYPDRILGTTRVEHEDNALQMGRTAGRILAGADETYDHTPYFWSQWWDTWLEAIGSPDASSPTVEDDLGDDKTVVYHLDESGRAVTGILMWGTSDKDAARRVLATQPLAAGADPSTLLGTIGG
ncbi:MAG TPA: NAD(P)/FAD-dependent oxidoreductase [Nocardioides sp.]